MPCTTSDSAVDLDAPGERISLLRDGAEAIPAMLKAIRAAQREVVLEMYWLDASVVGRAVPPREVYTCVDQGIHAGWFDLYDRALDCQYIDITDVPPGRYRVRARINELRGLTETRYDDNEAFREVEIPATDPPSTDPTDACPADTDGTARDCGWVVDRALSCAPGSRVTLGCNAACGAGMCAGNPALRVCAGDGPCTHAAAVAENDDACGTSCPSVTFTCPLFRNRYTVMTGGSRAGSAYQCQLEATEAQP